ncbi:septum formation initiator family protein [Streptomyces sp. NPDC002446]
MRGQGRPRGGQKRLSALFPASAAPGTAARTPFVLLIVVLLGSGLITLLVLNSALNQGSFELSKLERKTDELTDEQQALQQEVDAYSAPGALERRARGLGMVPGGTPAFLLPDGTVLGRPHVATSAGAPLSTSAEPSAASLLGARTLTAPSGAPRPPVAPPSVEPPVPLSSATLSPRSAPAAGGTALTPGLPAPAAPRAPGAAPASPASAAPRVPPGIGAPAAPGSAPAPSPTTSGR